MTPAFIYDLQCSYVIAHRVTSRELVESLASDVLKLDWPRSYGRVLAHVVLPGWHEPVLSQLFA